MFIGFCYSLHLKIKKRKHREGECPGSRWHSQDLSSHAPAFSSAPVFYIKLSEGDRGAFKDTMSHGLQSASKCIALVIPLNHLVREAVSSSPHHTWERLRVPPRRHPQGEHNRNLGLLTLGSRLYLPHGTAVQPSQVTEKEGILIRFLGEPRSSRASGRMRLHFLKVPQGNTACPPPERGPLSHPSRPTSCAFHTHACWDRKCSDPPPRGGPRSSHTHAHTHTLTHAPTLADSAASFSWDSNNRCHVDVSRTVLHTHCWWFLDI